MSAHQLASIYKKLSADLSSLVQPILCSKALLVHLSHTLEDYVLTHDQPTIIFTGFQESSHWRNETERYFDLARVAQQVCVFAGKLLPAESSAQLLQIELADGDPLLQEWFLIILCEDFSILLSGLEDIEADNVEEQQIFETILTFDPAVIAPALVILEGVIGHYRPLFLTRFQDLVASHAVRVANPTALATLMTDLLLFQNSLNRALAKRDREIRHIVSSINDHVYVFSALRTGGIRHLYSAPNMEQLNGYPVSRKETDGGFWLSLIHPDDLERVLAHNQQLSANSRSVIDYRMFHADGRLIWVRDSVRIEPSDDEDALYTVFGVVSDVTFLKEAEQDQIEREKLRLAFDKEHQLNQLKSSLLVTLAHEFRTPLATIGIARDILDRYSDRLSEGQRQQRLNTIQAQVDHLASMLDDIALIVKNDLNLLMFRPTLQDFVYLCQTIINEIRSIIELPDRVVFQSEMEFLVALVDARLIRFVLVNLLTNGLKYSEDEVVVSLALKAGQIHMTVRDQGIGISLEDQADIFQPFFRAPNAQFYAGSGLGLKVAYDCVQLHQGSITLESTKGEGSAFHVSIPFVQSAV